MQPRIDLNALGREQLSTLSGAVFGTPVMPEAQRLFDLLIVPGRRATTFPSFVTDDHTPFEFSIVLGPSGSKKKPELRVLAEPADDGRGLEGTIAAGRSLARALEQDYGSHLGRLKVIEDLFLPKNPRGAFAIWFAANLAPGERPLMKVYLNPLVQGAALAPALVQEMLDRLGMKEAWRHVARASQRGPERDELRFVSLDLVDSPEARVKVYAFHRAASVRDLQDVSSLARYSDGERLRRFCNVIAGGEGFLVSEREPGTCLSFVGDGRPRTCTVHLPIRSHAGDDETARARIELAIDELGLEGDVYKKTVAVFPRRPLRKGAGLHSYASLRFDADGPRLNLYLSPELQSIAPARAPTRPADSLPPLHESPLEVVERYENERPITAHPFLRRMARRPVDMAALALLLMNFREAITRDFARRLASVVARVEEDSLRCILTKQLNDELGNGDFSRAHSGLFEKLAAGLTPYLPADFSEAMLEPGRSLGRTLETVYLERSPYEGLGASLIMEVYGRQVDAFMGDQFRRQSSLPPAVLEWLTLHETLEVDHVHESFDLAKAIPDGPKAGLAARGARALARAGYAFFDALDEVYAP